MCKAKESRRRQVLANYEVAAVQQSIYNAATVWSLPAVLLHLQCTCSVQALHNAIAP